MMMSVEQPVEWKLEEETEVLRENLPQYHLSTTNPTWPDLCSNLGCLGGKPATNSLSYGMAFKNWLNIDFFLWGYVRDILCAKQVDSL
jgi:hypothetical protein